VIYYFSATGNTQWVAEQLAQATGERMVNIMELPQGEIKPALEDGERLGICFPVHGWRPPVVVRNFIGRLSLEAQGHYVYAACTAGDTLGETMDLLRQDLARRSIVLDACFSVKMPNTYVGLPFMDVDSEKLEREKLLAANDKLKDICQKVSRRFVGEAKLDIGRWPKINSRVLGKLFVDRLITDGPFRVDSARCVKCGICAEVCPAHDITGGLGQEPTWHHDGSCLTCFACYHHCPHHAIEYGNRTQKKGQYFLKHHRKLPLNII
jgi:NAD-dependent dihydropyrimidine dehydrogenase PreA subunit